jgi:hypothetical protein
VEEKVGLVASAEIHGLEAGLPEDSGSQITALSHLAIGGDLPVSQEFAQAGAQVVHGGFLGDRSNEAVREILVCVALARRATDSPDVRVVGVFPDASL